MSDFSDFLEQRLLNVIFRTQVAYKPTAIYIALFTAAPDDTGGGTEVTGGSYARQQVSQADAEWNAPGAAGLIDNVNDITFPVATANWGTVTHMAIFDAVTAGNLLFHRILTASKIVNTDDTFKFAVGDLDITLA
ncbi:MAG: hypothetical protein IIA70_04115 [Proteobacteria bacterium]|nr:hypothetical protein [Pseudomonadota bacterium]